MRRLALVSVLALLASSGAALAATAPTGADSNEHGSTCAGRSTSSCEDYDNEGFDTNGYDSEGYNKNGFDRTGSDRRGVTSSVLAGRPRVRDGIWTDSATGAAWSFEQEGSVLGVFYIGWSNNQAVWYYGALGLCATQPASGVCYEGSLGQYAKTGTTTTQIGTVPNVSVNFATATTATTSVNGAAGSVSRFHP